MASVADGPRERSGGDRLDRPVPLTPLPAARHLFVDPRGAGMRVSTHPERGLVVLSLWRDERSVGTFQLDPDEAGRLIAVLVAGLAGLAGTARSDPAQSAGAARRDCG